MPKNNSKARKQWRKARAEAKFMTPQERLLRAIFGTPFTGANDLRPGGRIDRLDDGLLSDQGKAR